MQPRAASSLAFALSLSARRSGAFDRDQADVIAALVLPDGGTR